MYQRNVVQDLWLSVRNPEVPPCVSVPYVFTEAALLSASILSWYKILEPSDHETNKFSKSIDEEILRELCQRGLIYYRGKQGRIQDSPWEGAPTLGEGGNI